MLVHNTVAKITNDLEGAAGGLRLPRRAVDPLISHPPTKPAHGTGTETPVPATPRERWARIWPSLLAVITLTAVGGPAAVAIYRHARDVIAQHGYPIMAP